VGVDILGSSDGVVTIRISGQLKKAEVDRAQAFAVAAITQWGRVKVLAFLVDFQGWEPSADWGDVRFVRDHGDNVERIAIVGHEDWRDLVYAFTGRGFRSTAIAYFVPSEEARARAWLGEERAAETDSR
jgi:SpoIIAA-like